MPEEFVLDPDRTAVLALDFIPRVVESYTFDGAACIERAAAVCAAARSAGAWVAHVTPAAGNGAPTAVTYHPGIVPVAGDLQFLKSKIGAFSTTGLDVALRAGGRDTLVIMGVATSGTVLSTTRWGYDLGYRVVVVSDGCSDPDQKVHELLTSPVYPDSFVGLWRLGDVATAQSAISALQSRTA